jgi:hypothetical protein
MSAGTIRVGTGGESYPASQLLSIVPSATSEWDRWSGKFSLGIVVRSGNTNQRDYNSILSLRRETGRTRFDVNGSVNYGTMESEKNVDNRQASAQLDVFVTKRLYVIPIAASAYADQFGLPGDPEHRYHQGRLPPSGGSGGCGPDQPLGSHLLGDVGSCRNAEAGSRRRLAQTRRSPDIVWAGSGFLSRVPRRETRARWEK